ncbi:transglutaminase domain-containing protein [Nevskia sp.]|uniref:transglutaminase domain-containing protein n=1 Tax=Nevskia sp. TaxID=1929292 RepID=UPI0025E22586|nr:transglutaminase domain-containing protein [Nevskia sp.]
MNAEGKPRSALPQHVHRVLCRCVVSLTMAIAGCATLPPPPVLSSTDVDWVLAGADLANEHDFAHAEPIETPESLLALTEDMREFALQATRNKRGIAAKTEALATALSGDHGDPGQILSYDVDASLSAEQAFRERRANCLSYTLLFVALARASGIPAQFNQVDIPPTWDLGDAQTLLLYRHINARVDLIAPLFQIIDVSGEEARPDVAHWLIDDKAALAQYYNNRAVELRLQQRSTDALRYQLQALRLLPDASYLWTNLASLYLLNDRLRAAGIAITQALSLDPDSLLSYNTAAQIHDALGNASLARFYRTRGKQLLDRNPYYHFQLALNAFDEHDDRTAYDHARRAVLLNQKDPRFFFLMAVLLERQGEQRLSAQALDVALKLTPDLNQQARYRSKFARLSAHG